MITVNGKQYPLWSQFVEGKKDWIGGTLFDHGDSMDRAMGMKLEPTKITDIILKPNGDDSAWFEVVGEDYSCGFDVHYGGVGGDRGVVVPGRINFGGYMGHSWYIEKP